MRLLIILALCLAITYGKLPPDVFSSKCPRTGSDTASCLMSGMQGFQKYLKDGINELNIPRLEPFKMNQLDLDIEVPTLKIKGEATNIVAYGGSKLKIKDLKVDMDNLFMEITVEIPRLAVSADYDTTGSKLMKFETSGSGQFKGKFNNLVAVIKMNGHSITRNKLEYVKLDELTVDLKFGNSQIRVDPDEKNVMNRIVAAFINTNGGTILSGMTPVIAKAAAPVIQRYLSKIFNVVPLTDVFTS